MERLTNWIDSQRSSLSEPTPVDFCNQCADKKCLTCSFQCAINRLAAYENTGYTPEEVQALKDAEEQGMLAWLPCKVGDTVYIIDTITVTKMQVDNIFPNGSIIKGELCNAYLTTQFTYVCASCQDFGKTVFLTYDEAVKALQEVRND